MPYPRVRQVVPQGSGMSWLLKLYLETPCRSRPKNELYRLVYLDVGYNLREKLAMTQFL